MDLAEVQEFVEKRLSHSDDNVGSDLIMSKLGLFTTTKLQIDGQDLPDEVEREAMGGILASIIVSTVVAAHERGIDLNERITAYIKTVEEQMEREQEFADAVDEGDIEKLADMIEEDSEHEVEQEDTEDGPAFY